MSYKATVVADSISEDGYRILTIECVFPRFILPEVNTYKSISASASSSRAIGSTKRINEVKNNPFIPEEWGQNQKGMTASVLLDKEASLEASQVWLEASLSAVTYAERLMGLGVHKQLANRILEPFLWQTNVMTANLEYFEHLIAQRDHDDAQPQFRLLAKEIKKAIAESTPEELEFSEWHLPYITEEEMQEYSLEDQIKISVARCARTSYDSQNNKNARSDIELYGFLVDQGHWAPLEMVAKPGSLGYGNLKGWLQLRHLEEDLDKYKPKQYR